jgi:hypothetical protein
MSESTGYGKDKCQVKISPKCEGNQAGYQRRIRYAQQGPWLDACGECARIPYEQPAQFQEAPANVGV